MPMKPQVAAHEFGLRLKDSAIIAAGSGTITTRAARKEPLPEGEEFQSW